MTKTKRKAAKKAAKKAPPKPKLVRKASKKPAPTSRPKDWQVKEKAKLADEMSAIQKKAFLKSLDITKAADILKELKKDYDYFVNEIMTKAKIVSDIDTGNYQTLFDFGAAHKENGGAKKNGSGDKKTSKADKAPPSKKLVDQDNQTIDAVNLHLDRRFKAKKPVTGKAMAMSVFQSQKKRETDRCHEWLLELVEHKRVEQDKEKATIFWVLGT